MHARTVLAEYACALLLSSYILLPAYYNHYLLLLLFLTWVTCLYIYTNMTSYAPDLDGCFAFFEHAADRDEHSCVSHCGRNANPNEKRKGRERDP